MAILTSACGRWTSAVLMAASSMSLVTRQSSTVSSVPAPDTRAAVARARGLALGYNLDYADALAAFREATTDDPHDATAYSLSAATAWIALLFEQGAITVDDYLGQARATLSRGGASPDLVRAFNDDLGRAQTLAEARLRDHPDEAEAHYRVGTVFGFRASYLATVEGRVFASLGPGRRAYREHERVLAIDPSRHDAGLIVGLYRYTIAALPAPLRLIARVVGFDADRSGGLALVEQAARYPSDVQSNALFTLILIYNRESRYDEALAVIGELQQKFPRNRLLWLEAGNTALRAGRAADACRWIEEGLARLAADPRPRAMGEDARWRFAHGEALVALRQSARAEPELRAALDGATRDWLRGRAHRELGKLADLAGDHDRAREEYRVAEQLCRGDHDDEGAEEARALLRTLK